MPPKASLSDSRSQHGHKQSTINLTADGDSVSASREKGKGKEKDTDKDKNRKDAKGMMPPPPPPSNPLAVLEPEFGALEDSLKNITITAAQIFRFYADTRRLGVQKLAPRPPRSLTSALEQQLGRYDQICDTVDARLSRSIAVLQRDLDREENRIREEEAEKARVKAEEASKADTDADMTSAPSAEAKPPQALPSGALAGTGRHQQRRPSKISLSTLHRSPFPLKLDLSSTSLRLGSDEGGLNMSALDNLNALSSLGSMGVDGISGLASPVTLAPKSARPMAPGELPPEVLAALASASGVGSENMHMPNPSQHVDIDLTMDDDLNVPTDMSLLSGAGSSADKPIELDLDLPMDVQMSDLQSDLFGDQGDTGGQQVGSSTDDEMEKLFGPETAGAASGGNDTTAGVDMNMLLSENHGHDDSLFASLSASAGNNRPGDSVSAEPPLSTQGEGSGGTGDFDYSSFFNDASTNQDHIDMMEFLKMNDAGAAAGQSQPINASASEPPTDT